MLRFTILATWDHTSVTRYSTMVVPAKTIGWCYILLQVVHEKLSKVFLFHVGVLAHFSSPFFSVFVAADSPGTLGRSEDDGLGLGALLLNDRKRCWQNSWDSSLSRKVCMKTLKPSKSISWEPGGAQSSRWFAFTCCRKENKRTEKTCWHLVLFFCCCLRLFCNDRQTSFAEKAVFFHPYAHQNIEQSKLTKSSRKDGDLILFDLTFGQ